jgi:hypothetical protein
MNTLTLGVGTGDRFRITFDYYAHGRLYSGEFQSPVAIPQNEKISLRYNPLNPEQNSRSRDELESGRSPIYVVGIVGSILLSVAWLAIIRGCR